MEAMTDGGTWDAIEEANARVQAAAAEDLRRIREGLARRVELRGVRQVAFLAGLAENTVRNFVAGRVDTSVGNLLLMCEAVGVKIGDLLP